VFLDETNGANLFSAYVDEDASIELVTAKARQPCSKEKEMRR
jgi:hypothetical protein